MIQVPPHAQRLLSGFDLVNGVWQPLTLQGLAFGGVGIVNVFPGPAPAARLLDLKALIATTDFDIDIDGPFGDAVTDPSWQGETSLKTAAGVSCDSRTFPGIVISPALEQFGVRLGDFGFCIWAGHKCCFQVYDIGPLRKAGEGSIFLARETGLVLPSQSDHHAATNAPDVTDVVSVIFPGTAPGIGTPVRNHAIAAALIEAATLSFCPAAAIPALKAARWPV